MTLKSLYLLMNMESVKYDIEIAQHMIFNWYVITARRGM